MSERSGPEGATPSPVTGLREGETLGAYRILRRLGAGGMGEVWAAQDTRLGREVAIKVLPPDFADDPSRRARFEREARTLAALSHPAIVTVFAVEELGGRLSLVMELVSGRRLGEVVPAGGLPTAELLRMATVLADAVGAAHAQGVTHRDLKPDNVMVTEEGRLKVLDFGLAKIDLPPSETAATMTASIEGRLVGTAAYMSPEQAHGQRADPRSDVFSLGLVLYEMATARRAFAGESAVAVMSAILRDTPPPLTSINRSVPPRFARAVMRCLEKDPARRYQTALDLRNDLEELSHTRAALGPWRRRAWTAAAILAAGAGGILVGARAWRASRGSVSIAAPLHIESFVQLTHEEGAVSAPSLAPDGKWFAFQIRKGGSLDVYRQRVGGENPQDLTPDSPLDDGAPAISPDGERIAFRSDRDGGGVFVMGATGESPHKVSEIGYDPAWTPDGATLIVATDVVVDPAARNHPSELYAVDLATGARRRVTGADAMEPAVSPHGKRVALWQSLQGTRDLATVPLVGGSDGDRVLVTSDLALDWNPRWLPDGSGLLFSSDRGGNMNVWLQPIDETSGRTLGTATPLTVAAGIWMHHASPSRDGRSVVLVAGGEQDWIERVRWDRTRRAPLAAPERVGRGAWPDERGNLLVFTERGEREDIVLLDLTTHSRRRLTEHPSRNRSPVFSPDGKVIAFTSNRDGVYAIWTVHTDGSNLHRWVDGLTPAWSRDGKRLAVDSYPSDVVRIIDLDHPDAPPTEIGPPPAALDFFVLGWSPDGRRVVCLADEATGQAIWIRDMTGATWRRIGSGSGAAWNDDGHLVRCDAKGRLQLDDLDGATSSELPLDIGFNSASINLDGGWLYWGRAAEVSDIWLARLAPPPAESHR